jgi:hypothetical protein
MIELRSDAVPRDAASARYFCEIARLWLRPRRGFDAIRTERRAAHVSPGRRREGMMKSVMKRVIWLYIVAACAYVFYEWYALPSPYAAWDHDA